MAYGRQPEVACLTNVDSLLASCCSKHWEVGHIIGGDAVFLCSRYELAQPLRQKLHQRPQNCHDATCSRQQVMSDTLL